MDRTIQRKIADFLKPVSEGRVAADVRIGLGYTSVRLDSGSTGLAWTAPDRSGNCTHEPKAGTLAGRPAGELLEKLASPGNSLSRTIGLAAANALAAGMTPPETATGDVLGLVGIGPADRVAMVGYFGPLVPRLREAGCRLDILELDREKPGTLSPAEGRDALAACSVAIITATSLITGTMDEILSSLGDPRAAVVLGPSTFMRPEVYAGTPVTHLAGSRVRDAEAVERIVSEGGGTMILKRHVDFETVVLGKS